MSIIQSYCTRLQENDATLTSIKLNYDKISSEDVKELAQALRVNSSVLKLDLSSNRINDEGAKEYMLNAPLFFGSISQFNAVFDLEDDPQEVIIDFMRSRVCDHSAIHAIQYITERYVALGKNLHLRHLSPECKLLLGKAKDMVETNVLEDPDYHIASNKLG